MDRKTHWETIYQTKDATEVSWYQAAPVTALKFFDDLKVPISASIIDIGGGDSLLVDHLLNRGYNNISVLDISAAALEKAKDRLGARADLVKWIVADITEFEPPESYDVWHDRAALHFLTEEKSIRKYIATLERSLNYQGFLILGTFSEQGPTKCSGLDIKQYSETSITRLVQESFQKIDCFQKDHQTPFGTTQNFIFCSFQRRK